MTMEEAIDSKIRGVLYGLYIGDALAMLVHWYYNRQALYQDYGRVTGYLDPLLLFLGIPLYQLSRRSAVRPFRLSGSTPPNLLRLCRLADTAAGGR